ncbi:effector-associated constant component EACC1 [Streptomyces sp. NPDC002403]
MATGLEVVMQPGSSRFDPEDQPWHDQVAGLHASLREEVGAVLRRRVPEPGQKGAVEATLLALGSSGALTAAVACFRAWLARDKSRTLTVTWTDGTGAEQRLHVTGDNIDQASFQALTEALGSWSGDN